MQRIGNVLSRFPWFPWLMLALVLIVGVPIFVRMPVWVDVTYHDVSAWNIMHGGAHYRDVFETNLPGMVWLHIGVRSLFGWSMETIRIADFLVQSGTVFLLGYWFCKTGQSLRDAIWFATAAALFYLFQDEFIHCQRDSWMLLPTVLALHLRWRQMQRLSTASPRSLYCYGFLEGMIWGCAIWIKPHALVPALFTYLVSLRGMSGASKGTRLGDILGLLLGGLFVGIAGLTWVWSSGSWAYMWDILLKWNQEYYDWSLDEFESKILGLPRYFHPWSLLHLLAIPTAIVVLIRRLREGLQSEDPWKYANALLAALYLGWLAEATFLQKMFPYAQAPVLILGLAFLASRRWAVGPIFGTWCLLVAILHCTAKKNHEVNALVDQLEKAYPNTMEAYVPHTPLDNLDRMALWPRCWSDPSMDLKDRLSMFPQIFCSPKWTDLEKVAEFLKTKNLQDGDLIAWHDTTHPLYIQLQIRPGVRFIHLITSLRFKSRHDQIQAETFQSKARFIVSDLQVVRTFYDLNMDQPPENPYQLPADFPDKVRGTYPWNMPIVFRSGRYVVHEIQNPHGPLLFPYPPGMGF